MNHAAEILRATNPESLPVYRITAFNSKLELPLHRNGAAASYLGRISALEQEARDIQKGYRASVLDEPGTMPAVPAASASRFEEIYPEIRIAQMRMTTAVLHEHLNLEAMNRNVYDSAVNTTADLALNYYRHIDVATVKTRLGEQYPNWLEDMVKVYMIEPTPQILTMLNQHLDATQEFNELKEKLKRRSVENTGKSPVIPRPLATPVLATFAQAGL